MGLKRISQQKMLKKQRIFIGITLPPVIRKELSRIQDSLKVKDLCMARWTQAENLHLTLKFLGEIDCDQLKKNEIMLSAIDCPAFRASLGGIGIFSSTKSIRIIWVQIAGEGIANLQKQVDRALSPVIEPEWRFMSHVTIGRVKSIRNRPRFLTEISQISPQALEFDVKEFSIFQSVLSSEGAIHSIIKRYPLSV